MQWCMVTGNVSRDWPRRKPFAEFRLYVEHDCLASHFTKLVFVPTQTARDLQPSEGHGLGSLTKCAALSSDRYWEARIKCFRHISDCIVLVSVYLFGCWINYLPQTITFVVYLKVGSPWKFITVSMSLPLCHSNRNVLIVFVYCNTLIVSRLILTDPFYIISNLY